VRADAAGVKTAMVKTIAGANGEHVHWREVLFKNDP
jgi:hypothetical protein